MWSMEIFGSFFLFFCFHERCGLKRSFWGIDWEKELQGHVQWRAFNEWRAYTWIFMMTWRRVIACICNIRASESKSLPLSLLQRPWKFWSTRNYYNIISLFYYLVFIFTIHEFMVFFCIIYKSNCAILTNFYIYL